jgi:hypothetical protein
LRGLTSQDFDEHAKEDKTCFLKKREEIGLNKGSKTVKVKKEEYF